MKTINTLISYKNALLHITQRECYIIMLASIMQELHFKWPESNYKIKILFFAAIN